MQQVSNNIIVIYPGEIIPEGTENSIKLFLGGSIDTRDDRKFDWADKFIKGLTEITDPQKGLIQYQGLNFVIMNSFVVPKNPIPNVLNPEFMGKMDWIYSSMAASDCIFLNFLKKSTATLPMFLFGYCCASGKLVVRCPEEYINYSTVYSACRQHNVPLLPGKVGSVLSVLSQMMAFTPKFQEIMIYQLPE